MSRRNIIILISLLFLVVGFSVFFYLYNLNKTIPPIVEEDTSIELTKEEIEKELSQFKIDPEDIKPREEVIEELNSFVPPPPEQTLTREEILQQLNAINNSNI